MSYKIALISDIHFGIKGNSETFLKTIEDFFLVTLKKSIDKYNIIDVRILGDLFDNRNTLNIRTLNSVIKVFKWYQLNYEKVKFKILLGNHDIYYHNRLDINSIEVLRGYSNIEIISDIKKETINGKDIISFPWLVEQSQTHINFNDICSDDIKYDVCFGHFEINGFEVVPGINHEGGVDSGKFKNFKRVFSGHFHLRRSNGHISYLGCPYQLTWADYGDEKGITIYDLDENNVIFEKNVDSPEHIYIKFDDLINKSDKLSYIKDNFVKFLIDKPLSDQIIIKALGKIESLKPKKLEVENNVVEEFNGESSESDLSKLNDPLTFLTEYIRNLEKIDGNLDKNEFISYIGSLYGTLQSEKI